MPKVPAKSLMPVTKKIASKPIAAPKLVFKKGVTDLASVIAYAADQEGIWPKDVFRFKDLRVKYCLPLMLSEGVVERAERIHRDAIRASIERYKPKPAPVATVEKTPSTSLLPVKKATPIPATKKVAKKAAAVKKSLLPQPKKSVAPTPKIPLKRIVPRKGIAVVKKSIKS